MNRRQRSTRKTGDPLPAVMTMTDLAELLGVSVHRIWQLDRAGELKRFELNPRLGKRVRYSGARVQAWLDGHQDAQEPMSASAAAGSPSRRYFRSH